LASQPSYWHHLGNVSLFADCPLTASRWPDLVVGLGILLMNLDAAREVFEAARAERNVARPVA
jgi:Co/Zn/Cd efflux system component